MDRQNPTVIRDRSDRGEDACTVLDRIRTELVDLHAATLGLQLRLAPTLAAAAGDVAVLGAGQDLDLLSQSLDGLATFAGAVSRCARDSGRLDAASAAAHVTLDALSSRLAGRAPPASPESRHGDLELF